MFPGERILLGPRSWMEPACGLRVEERRDYGKIGRKSLGLWGTFPLPFQSNKGCDLLLLEELTQIRGFMAF